MYPVVAHTSRMCWHCIPYCSYVLSEVARAARSTSGGPSGPSGPLLIEYGALPCHAYTITSRLYIVMSPHPHIRPLHSYRCVLVCLRLGARMPLCIVLLTAYFRVDIYTGT
jgi:hypothetical protein